MHVNTLQTHVQKSRVSAECGINGIQWGGGLGVSVYSEWSWMLPPYTTLRSGDALNTVHTYTPIETHWKKEAFRWVSSQWCVQHTPLPSSSPPLTGFIGHIGSGHLGPLNTFTSAAAAGVTWKRACGNACLRTRSRARPRCSKWVPRMCARPAGGVAGHVVRSSASQLGVPLFSAVVLRPDFTIRHRVCIITRV